MIQIITKGKSKTFTRKREAISYIENLKPATLLSEREFFETYSESTLKEFESIIRNHLKDGCYFSVSNLRCEFSKQAGHSMSVNHEIKLFQVWYAVKNYLKFE